jgi:hypothetical protein
MEITSFPDLESVGSMDCTLVGGGDATIDAFEVVAATAGLATPGGCGAPTPEASPRSPPARRSP